MSLFSYSQNISQRPSQASVNQKGTRVHLIGVFGHVLMPHDKLVLPDDTDIDGKLLKQTLGNSRRVGVVTLKKTRRGVAWSKIGTVGKISFKKTKGGGYQITLVGLDRFFLRHRKNDEFITFGTISRFQDRPIKRSKGFTAASIALKHMGQRLLERDGNLDRAAQDSLLNGSDPDKLCRAIIPLLTIGPEERLGLLAISDPLRRVKRMIALIRNELSMRDLSRELSDQVQHELDEQDRRRFLREKLALIKDELDEDDEGGPDTKLEQALGGLNLPPHIQEAVDEEIDRLRMSPAGSPEYFVSQIYLQLIADLPWGHETPEYPTIDFARGVLDRAHFGLKSAKEKVLESIAVMHRKGSPLGQVLLLKGPPGVGKTSLARAFADAMKRPFVKIALGGVKDESEIRGHRRTYVGSMPGKILSGIRQAGCNHPVILLDEIDKVSNQSNSDVASALLEVLDPEQNSEFVDHFLGLSFDLSKVIFLATANDESKISSPLRDRMDLVELSSYSDQEKLMIAAKHIIPRVRRGLGLKAKEFKPSHHFIQKLISEYTYEGGVRQLGRALATIGRKVVCEIDREGGRGKSALGLDELEGWLGPKKFGFGEEAFSPIPGLVVGLAYTDVGGEVLIIESSIYPARGGKGGLKLTGSLGPVMKESAHTVLSCLSSRADALGIDLTSLQENHIHLHFPDGATPKDGPSAGIAMMCSMVGSIKRRSMPLDLAMTGELTLSGRVMAVGGIREKVLAAIRFGRKRVIIPYENCSDLKEISASALEEVEIIPVRTVDEVLCLADYLT